MPLKNSIPFSPPHRLILIRLLLAAFCVISTHAADPIQINACFKSAASPGYSGAGVVGGEKDTWNKVVFNTDSLGLALVDSTGATTPVTLTRKSSGGNVWGAPWAAPLMGEFSYVGGPMTLKNLPPGNYDLLIYGFRGTSFTANGLTSPPCTDAQIPYRTNTFIPNRTYVVLHPVVAANGELTITAGGVGETVMFGFQLRSAVPNHPPTTENKTLTLLQNATHTFTATEFLFTDPDVWDFFEKIQITALPTAGSLTLNDAEVTPNQEISFADLSAGKLKFIPAPNLTKSPYATFQFRVSDGTDYSPGASTATINLLPTFALLNVCFKIPASPNYSGPAAIGAEGDLWNKVPLGPKVTDFSLNTPGGTPTGVTLDQGALYSSNAWGAPYNPPSLLGEFTYTKGTVTLNNLPPGNYDIFLYGWNGVFFNVAPEVSPQLDAKRPTALKVNDSYAVLHPIVDASGKLTITINGTGEPVFCGFQIRPNIPNHPPTAANPTVTILKNAVHTFTASEFHFADSDPWDSFQKLKVTVPPRVGSLKLSGYALNLDQEISIADLSAGELKFTPAPGVTGAPYATFQFRVSDGTNFSDETSYSTPASTATFNVIPSFNLINVCFKTAPSANQSGAAATGKEEDLWNKVPLGSQAKDFLLVDQSGAATGVTLDQGGNYPFTPKGDPLKTPPLLSEFTLAKGTVTLNNLAPGNYELYLYGWKKAVFDANGDTSGQLTAELPDALTLDASYALLHPVVDDSGKLIITISGDSPAFSGFQLHQIVPEIPPTPVEDPTVTDKNAPVQTAKPPQNPPTPSGESGRARSFYWYLLAAIALAISFLIWRAKKSPKNTPPPPTP